MAYGAGGDHGFSGAASQSSYNAAAMAHDNVPSDQIWAMDNGDHSYRGYDESGHVAEKASSGKKKWIIIGSILLLAAIIVGVVVGVVVSKQNSSSSNSGSSKSGDSKSGGKDSASPNFEKDPALHQVFWGMAYAPADGRPPWCANTQEAVNKDIQILSQLTTRLRLYGANCGVTQQVLKAIKDLKVDMKIYPAICKLVPSLLEVNIQTLTRQRRTSSTTTGRWATSPRRSRSTDRTTLRASPSATSTCSS